MSEYETQRDRLTGELFARGFEYAGNRSILQRQVEAAGKIVVTTERLPSTPGLQDLTWGLYRRSTTLEWGERQTPRDEDFPIGLVDEILAKVDGWLGQPTDLGPSKTDHEALIRICERTGLTRVASDVWESQGKQLQVGQFLAAERIVLIGPLAFSFDGTGRAIRGG